MKWTLLATLIASLSAIWSVFYVKGKKQSVNVESDPTLPESPPAPPESPAVPSPAPISQSPKPHMLSTFCDGIAQMEGANPANNNPGNCRCSPVGYATMYGHVTCNPHGFAVFPTKALGRMYLENLVHHRVFLHPTWTFYDFFADYAPSSDGNQPRHYAEWMAQFCGVSPQATLAKLLA